MNNVLLSTRLKGNSKVLKIASEKAAIIKGLKVWFLGGNVISLKPRETVHNKAKAAKFAGQVDPKCAGLGRLLQQAFFKCVRTFELLANSDMANNADNLHNVY